MKTAAPVAAILVCHRSGHWLAEAASAVAAQDYPSFELTLVRVGAVDVPVDADHVVDVTSSVGFAAAVNAALHHIGDSEFVLLLHDDAAPDPDVVSRLVARMEADPELAAVGPKFVEWDDPEVLQEVGGAVDRFGLRRSGLEEREVDAGQYEDLTDAAFASSACLLIRCDALRKAGGLDPDGWPLYEDVDLCWRLHRNGGRVGVETSARVRHARALSRGLRNASEATIRTWSERGRLRFMLANYSPLTLAVLLPQYLVFSVASALSGLVRRELWRVRDRVSAWGRVLAETPRILRARRSHRAHDGPVVPDHEILHRASRQASTARRYSRVALAGRLGLAWQAAEAVLLRVVRNPTTWVGLAAAAAVALTLRGVLGGGGFILGEARPLPPLGKALGLIGSRLQPAGLDAGAPAGPGLAVLGLVRSVFGATWSLRLLLVGPLLISAAAGARLGRVLGLHHRGRAWLAVGAAVNPATLPLVRTGEVQALIIWAASLWLSASMLAPSPGRQGSIRARTRWLLAWAATAALAPSGLLWLVFLGLGCVLATARSGGAVARLRRLALGVAGSFALTLPWSLEWFTVRSPLVGAPAAFVTGVRSYTHGGGRAFVVWAVLSLVCVLVLHRTLLALVAVLLSGVAWAAGMTGVVHAPVALAATAWGLLVALAWAARGLTDQLHRHALGWRQVVSLAVGGALAVTWLAAAGLAVARGTQAQQISVVATGPEPTGHVLWLQPANGGVRTWTTYRFTDTIRFWPQPKGPAADVVAGALSAAQARRTHRLGTLLSLSDISHVVALRDPAPRMAGGQADMVRGDAQGGAVVFRNDAWRGPAFVLGAVPRRPLTPLGLARLAGPSERAFVGPGDVTVPSSSGVLFLTRAGQGRWRIGGRDAAAVAGGRVADARAGVQRLRPPGAWRLPVLILEGLLALALVLAWMGSVYFAGPVTGESASAGPEQKRLPMIAWASALIPVAAGVAWIVYAPSAVAAALSSVAYCPGASEQISQRAAIVNPTAEPVRYIVRPTVLGVPASTGRVSAYGRATVDIPAEGGGVVESFGGRLSVATTVSASDGADTLLCARSPERIQAFPVGGRAATGETRALRESIVVNNPFSEDARISVRLWAGEEPVFPPAMRDIRVAAGRSVTIDPEAQLPAQSSLGAVVTVWKGRAIAARKLRRAGVLRLSLAAPAVQSGVLPRAATASTDTSVVAVNGGSQPATVRFQIVGDQGSFPPASLRVTTRARLSLDKAAPNQQALLVELDSSRALPIESVVVPSDRGAISVLPPLEPARRWAVPAAEDRMLVLANPGTAPARVKIRRLGSGEPFKDVAVPPGRIITVETSGSQFGVMVASDVPITAVASGVGGASLGEAL